MNYDAFLDRLGAGCDRFHPTLDLYKTETARGRRV